MLICLLLSFTLAHDGERDQHHSGNAHHVASAAEDKFANCNYDRNAILECVAKAGNAGDKGLCPERVQDLKDNVFIGGSLLSWMYPTKRVMDDCDKDRDGYITKKDYQESIESCVVDCMTVALLNFAICEPAKKKNYRSPANMTCFERFHKNGELKE